MVETADLNTHQISLFKTEAIAFFVRSIGQVSYIINSHSHEHSLSKTRNFPTAISLNTTAQTSIITPQSYYVHNLRPSIFYME